MCESDRFSVKIPPSIYLYLSLSLSVTRFGDLLDFGQLFKVCGNKEFAQIFYIIRQFL